MFRIAARFKTTLSECTLKVPREALAALTGAPMSEAELLKLDKSALADVLNEEAAAMEDNGVVIAPASSRDEDDMDASGDDDDEVPLCCCYHKEITLCGISALHGSAVDRDTNGCQNDVSLPNAVRRHFIMQVLRVQKWSSEFFRPLTVVTVCWSVSVVRAMAAHPFIKGKYFADGGIPINAATKNAVPIIRGTMSSPDIAGTTPSDASALPSGAALVRFRG